MFASCVCVCVSPGIGHLSLKRKGALSVAENGGSLRRSCEFGSDMLWPPPLESDGTPLANTRYR